MHITRIATLIAVAALAANPLYAQEKSSATPPDDRQALLDECKKEHGKHHDHTKEKGLGGGMVSKCINEKKGAKKAAKKPLHDHNREHKAN